MMPLQVIVVCGYGSSDIGKGWLATAIASAMGRTQVIKIDPFLNQTFPAGLGIVLEGRVVSDDFVAYRRAGLPIRPADNLLNGQVLAAALAEGGKLLHRGEEKKLTFADVAESMARRLAGLLRPDMDRMVIEIGGTISDREHAWIADALRLFGQMVGAEPQAVVLACLEAAEARYRLKTHNVRNAIRTARSCLGLPLLACFARRRSVPATITGDEIRRELFNVAFETQFPVNRIIFEDNHPDLESLCGFVAGLGLFAGGRRSVFISACLLGTRCRYGGRGKQLEPVLLDGLHAAELVTACPEVLGGLGIPRDACELSGGDGRAVLDGAAQVRCRDGADRTAAYIRGAERALEVVRRAAAVECILCDRSPSCGAASIYDGTFSRTAREGMGVFAALLARHGYDLRSVAPGPSS